MWLFTGKRLHQSEWTCHLRPRNWSGTLCQLSSAWSSYLSTQETGWNEAVSPGGNEVPHDQYCLTIEFQLLIHWADVFNFSHHFLLQGDGIVLFGNVYPKKQRRLNSDSLVFRRLACAYFCGEADWLWEKALLACGRKSCLSPNGVQDETSSRQGHLFGFAAMDLHRSFFVSEAEM